MALQYVKNYVTPFLGSKIKSENSDLFVDIDSNAQRLLHTPESCVQADYNINLRVTSTEAYRELKTAWKHAISRRKEKQLFCDRKCFKTAPDWVRYFMFFRYGLPYIVPEEKGDTSVSLLSLDQQVQAFYNKPSPLYQIDTLMFICDYFMKHGLQIYNNVQLSTIDLATEIEIGGNFLPKSTEYSRGVSIKQPENNIEIVVFNRTEEEEGSGELEDLPKSLNFIKTKTSNCVCPDDSLDILYVYPLSFDVYSYIDDTQDISRVRKRVVREDVVREEEEEEFEEDADKGKDSEKDSVDAYEDLD